VALSLGVEEKEGKKRGIFRWTLEGLPTRLCRSGGGELLQGKVYQGKKRPLYYKVNKKVRRLKKAVGGEEALAKASIIPERKEVGAAR